MAQIPKVPSAGSWTKQPSAGEVSSAGASPSEAAATLGTSGSLRSSDADTSSGVGFGSGTDGSIWRSESSSIHVTKAPEGLLYIALAAAVVSIALSALFESVVVAGISWVLAVLVGLGAATPSARPVRGISIPRAPSFCTDCRCCCASWPLWPHLSELLCSWVGCE